MKKKDLDALADLYGSVYSPVESGEYLIEAPQNDLGYRLGRGLSGALRDLPSGLAGQLTGTDNPALQRQRQRGRNLQSLLSTGKVPTSTSKPAAKPAAKPTLTDAEFDKKYRTTDPNNNLARPETGKTRINPPKPGGNAPPPTPGAGAKVAPTAAAKPKFTPQTGDKAKDTATWAKANPTLAAASAERARIRGTQQTDNPLMKDMKSRLPMNSPSVQSPSVSNLGQGNQSLVNNPNAFKAATPKPSTTPKKPMTQTQSFEWPSAKTIRDIAGAYASIYEAKKKDQDQDGDNDFADVRIARMIASGMSKAEAIAAVRNKEYNEEFESWVDSLIEEGYDLSDYTWDDMLDFYLDEATRMRKELGKEGETATRKELAARSRAYKRSGSVDKTIAAAERGADRPYIKHKRYESDADRRKREEKQSRTLRGLASSRRGSVRDNPRAGMRGYAAKVEGSDKDLQRARSSAMAAGTLTPKEKKQLGEEYTVYEIVASYLLENNFAETLNDANVIIENMSEKWIQDIIEQSAIAARAAKVVDDQRQGYHGDFDAINKLQDATSKSIGKLKRGKGPVVTPGMPVRGV